MAYTQKEFGLELKKRIKAKQDLAIIGRWAFGRYWLYKMEIDHAFQNLLKNLSAMENGPEFEFSYEELNKIADKLIAGERNIQLYKPIENLKLTLKTIYTRQKFGLELKEKIKNTENVESIGLWALSMYYEHMLEIDDNFQDFLTDLGGMSASPEFERSYEELNDIADRLIAGEDVKL